MFEIVLMQGIVSGIGHFIAAILGLIYTNVVVWIAAPMEILAGVVALGPKIVFWLIGLIPGF